MNPRARGALALLMAGAAVALLPVAARAAVALAPAGARFVSVYRDGRPLVTTASGSTMAGLVTLASGQTKVSGTFEVPSFTCTGTGTFEISVQLQAIDKTTPKGEFGFVAVECTAKGAKPTYTAGNCAGNACAQPTAVAVAPGNTITVSASFTKSRSVSTLDNVTTKKSETETTTGATLAISGNFIDLRVDADIPTFKAVVFKNCTANGKPISGFDPTSSTMTNAAGTTQVATNPLNKAGNGFTTAFKHN